LGGAAAAASRQRTRRAHLRHAVMSAVSERSELTARGYVSGAASAPRARVARHRCGCRTRRVTRVDSRGVYARARLLYS